MTNIQQFIQDAIVGGWVLQGYVGYVTDGVVRTWTVNRKCEILLDPAAWRAVGKTRGWEGADVGYSYWSATPWQAKMHQFVDALSSGQSIEEALHTL